jgi:3-isopropylmalate/(R)-2-methylmalate dehydratase small subunit
VKIQGRAVVVRGDHIDTDVLYPGSYLNIDDPDGMKPYLFEGLDKAIQDDLGEDTILVVDDNFGCGSSREHVPHAMRAWGIRLVIGKSFARIFHRNCVNLGLPIVTAPEASDAAQPGSRISLDTDTGEIDVDGRRFRAAPIPAFMLDMLSSGGLVAWAQRRTGVAS